MFSKKISLDYETFSELNLKKVGSAKYAMHHSTGILCLAWSVNDGPIKIWQPGEPWPEEFQDKDAQWCSHNAEFEICITKFVLIKYVPKRHLPPLTHWKCNALKLAAHSLPRKLEKGAEALKLPIKKDMAGHRLMLKHSKPRKSWTDREEGPKWHDDELERMKIDSYCVTDVRVEKLIDKKIPDVSKHEQKIWEYITESNLRGITIDVEMVRIIVKLLREENERCRIEGKKLCGFNLTQRDRVLEWCNERGAGLEKFGKEDLENCLKKKDLKQEVREVLTLRLSSTKTSNRKFNSMLSRVCADGRVRNNAIPHGASTGRETGNGLQILNLPKPLIDDPNFAIELIRDTHKKFGNEFIRLCYGNPLDVYLSCVRGMIKADEGKEIFKGDYSSIEARVLAWLMDQQDLLTAFRYGQDSYKMLAKEIYHLKKIEDVTDEQREVGKRGILACGFGQGHKGFRRAVILHGKVDLGEELCKRVVKTYRDKYKKIVNGWYLIEKAAIYATLNRGKKVSVCKVKWFKEGDFLWCELPSGRKLSYYKPFTKSEPDWNGVLTPRLYCWAEHPKKHKFVEMGLWHGALIENIVQAVARDIMVHARENLSKKGYDYLFSVYDEVICENLKGKGTEKDYEKTLTTLPNWAQGLPIAAKIEKVDRYKK